MNKTEQLTEELVYNKFNTEEALKKYISIARTKLWESEEILIEKYFKLGGRILDIGCGCGRVTFPLAEKGYRAIGIDICNKMIEGARVLAKNASHIPNFFLMDARNMQFDDNSFDGAIFSFNGLSEVYGEDNRSKILKETNRVLRPEGRFILSSPYFLLRYMPLFAASFICSKLMPKEERIGFGDRFYIKNGKECYFHVPKQKNLISLLESSGLDIVYSEKRNNLSKKDKKLDSFDCMFYVCEKK